ncbi:hypothetical protein SPAR65_1260 [Streptococcus pneumoniae GA40563]|nr:hypothetical protein SPAR65_1260 [Streptococcus pneumoniae GA40563]
MAKGISSFSKKALNFSISIGFSKKFFFQINRINRIGRL